MPDADNVRIGLAALATGGVYSAPTGTALPTTGLAALNAAFINLGYISEDGVTQHEGTAVTSIKAWQGGAVVRKVQTEHDLTFTFTMIETNAVTLAAFYGNNSGGTTQITGAARTHHSYTVEMLDGLDKIRIVIPDGEPGEPGDVVYKNDTVIGYQLTVSAYPDSAGVKAYIYQAGPDS